MFDALVIYYQYIISVLNIYQSDDNRNQEYNRNGRLDRSCNAWIQCLKPYRSYLLYDKSPETKFLQKAEDGHQIPCYMCMNPDDRKSRLVWKRVILSKAADGWDLANEDGKNAGKHLVDSNDGGPIRDWGHYYYFPKIIHLSRDELCHLGIKV